MPTIRIHDILKDKVLVSRESARLVEHAIRSATSGGRTDDSGSESAPVTLDFEGVEGVAPSFVDELISIIESTVQRSHAANHLMVIVNPPTRLSSKFEAIARGHEALVRVRPDGAWVFSRTTPQTR